MPAEVQRTQAEKGKQPVKKGRLIERVPAAGIRARSRWRRVDASRVTAAELGSWHMHPPRPRGTDLGYLDLRCRTPGTCGWRTEGMGEQKVGAEGMWAGHCQYPLHVDLGLQRNILLLGAERPMLCLHRLHPPRL